MPIIDVHTHMFTRPWLDLLRKHGAPYNVKVRPDGKEEIFRHETPVVFPQPGHFDYELRIQAMDAAGIDMSIVSLTCPNVYWGNEEISARAARESNDTMIAAQKKYPGRIRWFTSLPWEYPARAIEELARTCDNGASGVMVIANIAGRSLTEPFFAPIWEEIDRRAPAGPGAPRRAAGRRPDGHGQIRPELVGRLHVRHDARRHPHDLRRVLRPLSEPEADRRRMPAARCPTSSAVSKKATRSSCRSAARMKRKPTDYLRHIYYDCITYDLGALRYLISVVGADRVMFGTDWPHQVHDIKGSLAHTAALPKDQCDAIRGGNAKRVFKL